MTEASWIDLMTSNIKHWRRVHSGVLTPKGNRRKVPWIIITRCVRGHLTLTGSKHAAGWRFRCEKHGWRPGSGTIKCEAQVEIVEIPDMEETCGVSIEKASELHEQWREKYT